MKSDILQVLCLIVASLTSSTQVHPAEDLKKMTFSPPVLSDEEEHSVHLPDNLKCDACRAVAVQLTETFAKAESKLRSGRKLKESEVVDLTEKLCESGYGLKAVDGINRLSGPGLEAEGVVGMMQMGGKWPKRLQATCSFLIGELSDEEKEAYDSYTKDPNSLFPLLCKGPFTLNSCKSIEGEERRGRIGLDEL